MKTHFPCNRWPSRWPIAFALLLAGAPNGFSQSLPQNAFVKITSGAIVNDMAGTQDFGWADYDGDGDLDLLVANNSMDIPSSVLCLFYRNDGDGSFTRVTDSPLATKLGSHIGVAWADYDNDGHVDVFVPNADGLNNILFRNLGGGQLTEVTGPVGTPAADGGDSWAAGWMDYDRDGHLDLFVGNVPTESDEPDFFYRNKRDGTFTKLTTAEVGELLGDANYSEILAPADYNNDGIPDLVRTPYIPDPTSQTLLLRGAADGRFASVDVGSVTRDIGYSPTWGDCDNDGDLDLFIQNRDELNQLYLNNGNGTFVSVDNVDPLWDEDRDIGAAWVDYDNDGFLDLFLAFGNAMPRLNELYRNNLPNLGNANCWLKVNLEGTVSSRSGIGAKIRAKAVIRGEHVWQLREIASTGSRAGAQQGLLAHFGLGDAAKVDVLRIEWPSGIVQELRDVPANQMLTVTEPPRLIPQGAGAFQIQCWIHQSFEVQASTDLTEWTTLKTVTHSETGTLPFVDAQADLHQSRYYRVMAP